MLQSKDPYTGIPLKSSSVRDQPGEVASREDWYRKRGWVKVKAISKCGFVFLTFVEEKNKERYLGEGLLQSVEVKSCKGDSNR